MAIQSGVALPTRPQEPTEAKDPRILCDVPAPDYQVLDADRERQLLTRERITKLVLPVIPAFAGIQRGRGAVT